MTIHRLFIVFFTLYTVLIPVMVPKFVAEYTSASTAMMGCGIIIAFLFWSRRTFILNLLIAFYVFQNYLTRPYISVFEGRLSPESLQRIRSLRIFETPESAAVVYWNLFYLLLAWCIGLLLLRSPRSYKPFSVPRLFRMLDAVVRENGLPFVGTVLLLTALNYESPGAGLQSALTGEGEGLFLFGLTAIETVVTVCLYVFLREYHRGQRPGLYLLLLPILLEIGSGLLAGSRSAGFSLLVLGLIYWLMMGHDRKWRPLTLLKSGFVFAGVLALTFGIALFAQGLRNLFRYSISFDVGDILGALSYSAVINTQDVMFRGITELFYRLSSLKAQIYILNDWYVHHPWQHYNPVTTTMRVVNSLLPGDFFPDILSINQLFDYVYLGNVVSYNSEMWSIQGTLYLYFGHLATPLVVLIVAMVANQLYPRLKRPLMLSPALAAFFITLMLDLMTNGTMERIVNVDLVRPLAQFFVFVVVYKSFSLILPSRIRLWTRARSVS